MAKGHKHATIPQILMIGRLLEERLVKDESGQVRVVDGVVEYLPGWGDDRIADMVAVSKGSVAGIRQKSYGRLHAKAAPPAIDCGIELRVAFAEQKLAELSALIARKQSEIAELVTGLKLVEERLARIEKLPSAMPLFAGSALEPA